jgi:hypothetical protein
MFTEVFTKDDYYEIDKKKDYRSGRIAWAVVFYAPAHSELKRILFDKNGNPSGEGFVDREAFTEKSHGPFMYPYKLEINEEILHVKAKKRPVILLQTVEEGDIWKIIKRDKRLDNQLKLGKTWLVLPLYTYTHADHKVLVEHLYYPPFFPFVPNGVCPEEESFGRFDRIQMTHMTLITAVEYVLKDVILTILTENLISYFTNFEFGESYPYLRQTGQEELRKKGVLK